MQYFKFIYYTTGKNIIIYTYCKHNSNKYYTQLLHKINKISTLFKKYKKYKKIK